MFFTRVSKGPTGNVQESRPKPPPPPPPPPPQPASPDRFEERPAPKVQLDAVRPQSPDEVDRALTEAKREYDAAKEQVDYDNKKLTQHLARLGPALTDAQKKAYIVQFRTDHAEDYAKYETATTQLGDALKAASAQPSLPPSITLHALDAAKSLAETPEGALAAKDFAVTVARKLETNPRLFSGGLNNVSEPDAERQLQDIVSTALPNLYAEELKASNGDTTAAGDAFAAQVEGIERLRVFSSSAESIKKGVAALKNHDFPALAALDDGNAFGKSFKVAGVALGIASLASGADVSATEYLSTLASTGEDGLELVAKGMKALATSAKVGAKVAGTLDVGASFAARLAPGLGVAANALATAVDAGKLMGRDGNSGDALAVVGDAVATAGSLLAFTGVGEVAAAPLQTLGTLIAKTGNLVSDGLNREQLVAEERKLLEELGLGETADPLARASPEALEVLSGSMSPEEIQQLVTRTPGGFTSDRAAREFLAIRERPYGYYPAHG